MTRTFCDKGVEGRGLAGAAMEKRKVSKGNGVVSNLNLISF